MGKKDKLSIREIQILLRVARQVARGVACHSSNLPNSPKINMYN